MQQTYISSSSLIFTLKKYTFHPNGEDALPLSVRGTASWVPTLYEQEPASYIESAKPKMTAHLSNIRRIEP
jgi:hypothetical protein